MSTPIVTNIDPAKVRRPLGRIQRAFLKCCEEHGAYSEGSGWVWGGRAQSLRLAQGLMDRGLLEAVLNVRGRISFKVSEAGRAVLASPAPGNTKETSR